MLTCTIFLSFSLSWMLFLPPYTTYAHTAHMWFYIALFVPHIFVLFFLPRRDSIKRGKKYTKLKVHGVARGHTDRKGKKRNWTKKRQKAARKKTSKTFRNLFKCVCNSRISFEFQKWIYRASNGTHETQKNAHSTAAITTPNSSQTNERR